MYVALRRDDPCFGVTRRLADATGWNACILDGICSALLYTRACTAMGFAMAESGRLDEFGKGRDGLSRGGSSDEVHLERRSRLEVGNFYTQRRACDLDSDRHYFVHLSSRQVP